MRSPAIRLLDRLAEPRCLAPGRRYDGLPADSDLPDALLDFLDFVQRLDVEMVRPLAAWQDDPDDLSRPLARRAAHRELRRSSRWEGYRKVQRALNAWAGTSRDLVPGSGGLPTLVSLRDVDEMGNRVRAVPHLLDVAAALLLSDRLSEGERRSLMRPWQAVVDLRR